jgi:hypothetical protein
MVGRPRAEVKRNLLQLRSIFSDARQGNSASPRGGFRVRAAGGIVARCIGGALMNRDEYLSYGMALPLPLILDHPRFGALSRLGLELRRAAARVLNDAIVESGTTRTYLARLTGVDYPALTLVCTARRNMDIEVLKAALWALGRDWRGAVARFEEALDHRGRGLPSRASRPRSPGRPSPEPRA